MQLCYQQSKFEFYLTSFHYADTQRSWHWWIWQIKCCWKVVLVVHVLTFFQGRPLKVHFYDFLARKLLILLEKSNISPVIACIYVIMLSGVHREKELFWTTWCYCFQIENTDKVMHGVTLFILSFRFLCISCSLPGLDANIWSCVRVYPHDMAPQSTKFQRMQQISPLPSGSELIT